MNRPTEISAHELSEHRQKQWVEDEVKRRGWSDSGGKELVFNPDEAREQIKQSRLAHTQEVRIQIP
jgi:hypothetical protein